jgi:hypothetical protein
MVIADLDGSFVNFLAALITEPPKVILLSGSTLALEDDEPGVLLESRRVGHSGWAEEDLAGFDVSGVLFAGFVTINEMLHAGELQCNFVRRVDVKIPALFTPATQKRDRFRILPQDTPPFAFGFDVVDDAFEIDRNKFLHNSSREEL